MYKVTQTKQKSNNESEEPTSAAFVRGAEEYGIVIYSFFFVFLFIVV